MNDKLLYDIAKLLVEAAKNNETITYSQVSNRLNNKIAPKNLGHPIGELSKKAYEMRLPLISVIVVNSDSGVPGDGFYKIYSDLKGVSESEAMNNFQQEIEEVYNCNRWEEFLRSFGFENNEVKHLEEFKEGENNPRIWLVVHDMYAYNENSRLLGFSDKVYNAKNLNPKDIIVYYFSGTSTIKGIYEVCEKPWQRDNRWTGEHQIQIKPILELESDIDFKSLVPHLELFQNKAKWSGCIQGIHAIREISEKDFKVIEGRVYQYCIDNLESQYREILEDDKSIANESIEVKINRIKRKQQIVNRLKSKYNNCCQIEECNFTFKKKNGEFYSEAHHIELLSEGGSQDEDNVVILCPNHHRMFHYSNVEIFDLDENRRKIIINGEGYYIKY